MPNFHKNSKDRIAQKAEFHLRPFKNREQMYIFLTQIAQLLFFGLIFGLMIFWPYEFFGFLNDSVFWNFGLWYSALWFSAFRSKILYKHFLYWNVTCDCKLWNAPWFIAFFGYFHTFLSTIHVWSIVSSQNIHWLCVLSIHTFWYDAMPDVTTSCGRFSGLIGFVGNFNISIFIKLS